MPRRLFAASLFVSIACLASPLSAQVSDPCFSGPSGDCSKWACGDSVCDLLSESCSTCPIDCGACRPSCVAPPSGLVAWWPFDASTSFAYPNRVGHNYAFKNGGMSSTVGKVGQAVRLDGIDGYLRVLDDDAIDFSSHDFSIAFWMRTQAGNGGPLLAKREPHSPWPIGWSAHVVPWPAFFLSDGVGPGADWGAGGNTSDGLWHHVGFSIDRDDPSGFEIYLDGYRLFSGDPLSAPGSVSNDVDLIIGNFGYLAPHSFWEGQLDELQIFDRALSPAEMQRIYDSGSTGLCPPDAPSTCPGGSACSADIECGYDDAFGLLGGCYQGLCVCK